MKASEYPDDARRIERDYVDPNSVTHDDIKRDLEDAQFNDPDGVAEAVMERDDVPLDSSNAHRDGVTTREDVERAVAESDEIGYSPERRGAISDRISREVGAPSEQNLQRAEFSTLSESVTPGDVVEGDTRTTPVSVVRNLDGDVVGTVGARGASEAVAEELGGSYLGDVNDYNDTLSAKPTADGREAMLYSNGEPVGRVDL